MRDEGEIFIDPGQPAERNAQNLATLRELRAHFYRLARNEADWKRALELLGRAWTLDEVIRMGEAMEATLDAEREAAGHSVELFSGRFYEVRPDGWGPNPLRVWDVRRAAIANTFATPEAASGYAREKEAAAEGEECSSRRRLGLAAAGLALLAVAAFGVAVWRWL